MKPLGWWLELVIASGFAGIGALRFTEGGWLSFLLAGQCLLIAMLLVLRHSPCHSGWWPMRLFSWGSALLPLLMVPGPATVGPGLLQAAGLSLALAALAFLRRSFGVSPADRPLVVAGPYRWLRHPVYAGELLSFVGVWLSALTAWNTALLLAITGSLVARIRAEERVLGGYPDYANQVRWRLVPGIW